jgi:hypothetical protein
VVTYRASTRTRGLLPFMAEPALSKVEGRPLCLMNDRLPGPGASCAPLCFTQEIVIVIPAPLGQFSKSAVA